LNPDVEGSHIERDPTQAIGDGVDFFRPFTLVVASQMTERLSLQLEVFCKELAIPVVLITSVGFVGKLRICVTEHCVCETKPDSELGDLRLTDPFSELRRFVDNVDLDCPDLAQHAHVPYIVILIRGLDEFRQNTGKQLPSTREEKEHFKGIIMKMRRSDQETNFAEALENAYKAWVPYSIPEPVQKVLEIQTADSRSDFWVVARAVAQFVRDCGKLPLSGVLPDMTASTESYVKLQEIYNSRAEGDCAAINAHVATIHQELGITTPISREFVKRFCQNAQHVEVFSFRSLEEELRPCNPEEGGLDLAAEASDEDSLVQWYVALRAADHFRGDRGHWPGALCGDMEEDLAGDLAALTQAAARVVDSYKVEGIAADSKCLQEIVRCGGCEIHTTSSVLGGIASQEAVKLLTKQYSPLCNTLIYDGLHNRMQTLEL